MNADLVKSIVYHLTSRATSAGAFDLGVTKLVKLLYLIDCEFFRWSRKTATGAPWIFYHYGPYSDELVAVVKETPGVRFRDPVDLDGEKTFKGCELVEYLPDPLARQPLPLRAAVDSVCDHWLAADLPTLLDHVYFRTEPMTDAVRLRALDFSKIPNPKLYMPEAVPNIGASISTETKELLRRRLVKKREELHNRGSRFNVELDQEAIEAMRKMDAEDSTDFPAATVRFTASDGKIQGG